MFSNKQNRNQKNRKRKNKKKIKKRGSLGRPGTVSAQQPEPAQPHLPLSLSL
jgi:hypothetical protein